MTATVPEAFDAADRIAQLKRQHREKLARDRAATEGEKRAAARRLVADLDAAARAVLDAAGEGWLMAYRAGGDNPPIDNRDLDPRDLARLPFYGPTRSDGTEVYRVRFDLRPLGHGVVRLTLLRDGSGIYAPANPAAVNLRHWSAETRDMGGVDADTLAEALTLAE